MKISATFIATSFALAATTVAAGWEADPSGLIYRKYCDKDGEFAGTIHVCFATTNPNFASMVNTDSHFRGYFSKDKKGFVLVPIPGGASIIVNSVTMTATFDVDPVFPIGKHCTSVEFRKDGTIVKDAGGTICQPGGKVMGWLRETYAAPEFTSQGSPVPPHDI
ncbi:uncharacterized protein UTRI_10015 [Ustilago trichophora]|uniref:Uncharacterized protein n=1 Tax=Ustilago trichophora TaxID=86804 RepID=A0A5C3DP46_9BASI|nr:uncharacterized protein UTRI_10015 [Ustilago trichophora]